MFEVFDNSKDKYIFMGQVELCGEPYVTMQYDKERNYRKVWVFPLKPLGTIPAVERSLLVEGENSTRKTNEAEKLDYEEVKKRAEQANSTVGFRKATVNHYQRDIYVAEFAKRRANGTCELCETRAPFKTKKGEPYLESHHIVWLSNGGEDSIKNTVALCPNCNRKMHSLNLAEDILKLKKKAIENINRSI